MEREIALLKEIIKDVEQDVSDLEGQEFNGKNVAVAHGKLSACVAAIAEVLAAHLKEGVDKPVDRSEPLA